MIPAGLTHKHFDQAMKYIDQNGVPAERESVHYDLLINNKRYPPKYIISLATKFATGAELSASKFDATETKKFFEKSGYIIMDRRISPAAFKKAELLILSEDDEEGYAEGAESYGSHRKLERSGTLPKKAKAKRLAETGKLECDVCGIDFHKVYGDLGLGFIEAHHKLPISRIKPNTKTKIKDLALVCSNCHRMLHKGKVLHSIESLKSLISNIQKTNSVTLSVS